MKICSYLGNLREKRYCSSLDIFIITTLFFLEPPYWMQEPIKSQVVEIGSDVQIKCSASGKPLPTITWIRNGEPLQGR